MRLRALALLGGVSAIAISSAAAAQESQSPLGTFLGTITLIFGGQENIEATGGAVVTEEDIAALQPADVSELFARESAVTVSGGAGPSKRIHIFGMEQSNLAVSVDGVPQARTAWHHTGSGVIDPYFLKRVEVEAGAAAADAGFGAAAGAVRYETLGTLDLLEDGQTLGGRVTLSYGSNGRGASGSLAGFGKIGAWDWFIMAHGSDGKDYKAGNGKVMQGTAPAAMGIVTKFGYESDTHRLELSLSHTADDADRAIKMNMDLPVTTVDGRTVAPLDVTNDTLSLKYTTTASTASWDPEVLLFVSKNAYWRPDYIQPGFNGDMDLATRTFGGKVQNTFTLGTGTITAGIDFANDDYSVDNYGATNRRFWDFSTLQIGAFVQNRFEFDNGIDISAGGRFDYHRFDTWDNQRLSDTGASLNATLSYEVAPGFEIFAGASETWLGYGVGEFGLLHARPDTFIVDPDYEPATATNVKVGLNASGESWSGGITFFDTRLKDLARYDTSITDDPFFGLENAPEARSKGVTLTAAYRWGTSRIGASYTKADVTTGGQFALPEGGTVMPISDMASLYIDTEIPGHDLKLGATVEWAGKLSDAVMTAGGFADHNSYTVVNAYAEWAPPSVEGMAVRLGIDNLLDENYYERSSYVQRISGRLVEPHYAPGRTVSLGVNMKF